MPHPVAGRSEEVKLCATGFAEIEDLLVMEIHSFWKLWLLHVDVSVESFPMEWREAVGSEASLAE